MAGVVAVAVVAFAATAFAHFFRESLFWVAEQVTGEHGSVKAVKASNRWAVFAVVGVGIVVAAEIGRWASRWHHERLGIAAIAAAAREEGPGPSVRGTAMRNSATWVASVSTASIGRESAILEMGGALGVLGERTLRRPGMALATTGITAAFATAYHAPFAAVMYVEEHLGVREDRRHVVHALAGAALGFYGARWAFDATRILPQADDVWRWQVLALVAAGLLPGYVASRLFLAARERLAQLHKTGKVDRRLLVGALAAVSAAIVALVPLTAGNGAESVREAATNATLGVGLALLIGKLAATTASIGSGAPGGVVFPSLAVAAGSALVCDAVLRGVGVELGSAQWDSMLVLMAVGVAVSVQAPLMAVFLVPEMAGDLSVVPFSALAVIAVWGIDRLIARWSTETVPSPGEHVPVHDEDA